MGCLPMSRKIHVPETPRPPHGKSMGTDEEPPRVWPWLEKQCVSTNYYRPTQSLGQTETRFRAPRDENDQMVDLMKIKQLLDRRHSERQAMEAFWADVTLRDPANFPRYRDMGQMGEKFTRGGGGETLLTTKSVDPFAPSARRHSRRHSLPGLSRKFISKTRVVAPQYLIGEERYYPRSLVHKYNTYPMVVESYPNYNGNSGILNPYGQPHPTPMNSNIYECRAGMEKGFSSIAIPNINSSNKPHWSGSVAMSTRSSSQGSSHSIGIVMGKKPKDEDCISQSHMANDHDSQVAVDHLDSRASCYRQVDDTSEKPGLTYDTKAHSYPGKQFCKQWLDPSEVDNSISDVDQPSRMPGIDHLSAKSTETKKSKHEETPESCEHSGINSEPVMSTNPIVAGTAMSKMLEGVMSDATDSSASIKIDGNYEDQNKETEYEDWEFLIRDVSESSSSSLVVAKNAMATNIDPILKQTAGGLEN